MFTVSWSWFSLLICINIAAGNVIGAEMIEGKLQCLADPLFQLTFGCAKSAVSELTVRRQNDTKKAGWWVGNENVPQVCQMGQKTGHFTRFCRSLNLLSCLDCRDTCCCVSCKKSPLPCFLNLACPLCLDLSYFIDTSAFLFAEGNAPLCITVL